MSHDTPRKAPLVIAHRTTMGHTPENTLLGIRRAMELGCDGVEFDVRLCADGSPVLIHDDRLDRTTDGDGRIAERSLHELTSIDAGEGERIPQLRDALSLVDGRMLCAIELKVSEGDDVEALCQAVLSEIDAADAMPWSWLWSFDTETVIALTERAHQQRRIAHLCVEPTPEIWRIVTEHQLDGIAVHHSAVSAAQVQACRAHNLAAFVWTVNEEDQLDRCVEFGVTGIVGDYPERIQAAVTKS